MTQRSPVGSVVIPAHNEAPVIRRCLDALFAASRPASWTSSSSATAARTTPRRWPGRPVTRSGWSSWARRRSPPRCGSGTRRRRRSPALPGRRRGAARVGRARGAGAAPGRRGRRPATDPLRQRAARPRRCAATTAPDHGCRRSWDRSGAPASTACRQPAGGGSAPFRTSSPTTSGWTGTSTADEVEIVDCAPVRGHGAAAAAATSCGCCAAPTRQGGDELRPDLDGRAPETIGVDPAGPRPARRVRSGPGARRRHVRGLRRRRAARARARAVRRPSLATWWERDDSSRAG